MKKQSGNKPASISSRSAASGERRALIGLRPQYRAAASLVLRALRDGTLEFLELTHDENGQVDDFVIGSALRVDAYQVKWREQPGLFTFNSLIKPSGTAPALIAQLADGHRRLTLRYSPRRVVVHLYSCDQPSHHAKVVGKAGDKVMSFADFIDQVWNPAHRGDTSAATRQPRALEALQAATGLAWAEFFQFVQDCELDFGMTVPTSSGEPSRDASMEQDQIRLLAERLQDLAVDPERVHHFDRENLLSRLNWAKYFELRNRHDFPVVPSYEPIETTKALLSEAIARRLSSVDALVEAAAQTTERVFEWGRYFVPLAKQANVLEVRRLADSAMKLRDQSLTLLALRNHLKS